MSIKFIKDWGQCLIIFMSGIAGLTLLSLHQPIISYNQSLKDNNQLINNDYLEKCHSKNIDKNKYYHIKETAKIIDSLIVISQ